MACLVGFRVSGLGGVFVFGWKNTGLAWNWALYTTFI